MIRAMSYKLLTLLLALTLLVGCGNQKADGDPELEGVGKFTYSISGGFASLSVVFENLALDAGARIPLTRPAGAFIELMPDFFSNGILFKISVPLASLLPGGTGLPIVGLPDGRPIPGVTLGSLGAIAVNVPVLGQLVLYMGTDVYGIFIPLVFPKLGVMISVKIRDERGNLLGIIFGIPKTAKGQISGVLFLFPVEGSGTQETMSFL